MGLLLASLTALLIAIVAVIVAVIGDHKKQREQQA